MVSRLVFGVFVLVLVPCPVSSAPFNLEAEWFAEFLDNRQAPGERIIFRGNANNDRNLWLKKDERLTLKFCLLTDDFVAVRNIAWSNDGWLDTILVKIDNIERGRFTTNDNSNWGYLWNTMYESGPVGSGLMLKSGEHSMTLEIVGGDRYGVEIDRVVLAVDGERSGNLVCPGTGKNHETRSNQPEKTDGTNATASGGKRVDRPSSRLAPYEDTSNTGRTGNDSHVTVGSIGLNPGSGIGQDNDTNRSRNNGNRSEYSGNNLVDNGNGSENNGNGSENNGNGSEKDTRKTENNVNESEHRNKFENNGNGQEANTPDADTSTTHYRPNSTRTAKESRNAEDDIWKWAFMLFYRPVQQVNVKSVFPCQASRKMFPPQT